MKVLPVIHLACALSITVFAQGPPPRFEDYPIRNAFEGEVIPPQFVTAEQRQRSKDIGIAAIRRPTFAGYYTVVEMFCGTRCEEVAIVDARTGIIYPSPFKTAASSFALPPPTWDSRQPEYRVTSKMFIVRNVCPDEPAKCANFYFVWDDNRFNLVYTVSVPATPVIPSRSPLIGAWEGSWEWSDGISEQKHFFQFKFHQSAGRLMGGYAEHIAHHNREYRVEKLEATSPDKSTYRMEIAGNCWNVRIEGDILSGVWNGGKCSAAGLGVGARLFALEAKQVGKVTK